ncbi:MAG TPA: SWIM zinc finger family protein, partial [Candidatus Obscuribacterales bacterium]
RIAVDLRYAQSSQLVQGESEDRLLISANTLREPVSFRARVKENLLVRECLGALYDVVSGDFSYKPKDRSAYLAFQAMKKQSATASAWEARQAYFDWVERNDPNAWLILDPVVSVFPDRLTFEVFSRDEGAYALASIANEAFDFEGQPPEKTRCGTTNIDFSEDFATAIERMRSYHQTWFEIGSESVAVETARAALNEQGRDQGDEPAAGETFKTVEKKIRLPFSWLRGFLQVQSAGLLSRSGFALKPMDFYNLLRHLRLHKDQKKGGRAIRIELVPGQVPRLVLEPWNLVMETTGGIYKGSRPEIVRLWGRRRLKLLARLLPLAQSIEVHVLGSGMPAYFVIQAGPVSFTLALTGFSASNWSQSLAFDLILPREEESDKAGKALDRIVGHLKTIRSAGLDELSVQLKLTRAEVLAAVQSGCQQGLIIYDLHSCRLRPLLDEPLPLETLRFRNRRERLAYDLLAKSAVRLESEEHIHEVGVELVGKVKSAAENREYRPLLRLNPEGRVLKADCSCSFFRKHQLKEGPCEHLIALRLRFGQLELARRDNPDRDSVRLETRSYSKRHDDGSESVYRLSLDQRRLIKRWSLPGVREKKHAMVYNSADDARKAYFGQIDILEAKGFIDVRS